jgi:hypothetical protein
VIIGGGPKLNEAVVMTLEATAEKLVVQSMRANDKVVNTFSADARGR